MGFPMLVGAWLGGDPRFEVVGTVDAGEPLKRLVAAERPDVVVLDLVLPDVDEPGVLVRDLRAVHPGLRVLLVSSAVEDVLEAAARDAGSDGHARKSSAPDVLLDAVERAAGAA